MKDTVERQNGDQDITLSTHIFKAHTHKKENSLKTTDKNGNKITLSKWKLWVSMWSGILGKWITALLLVIIGITIILPLVYINHLCSLSVITRTL